METITPTDYSKHLVYELATVIRKDWQKPHLAAMPYLSAMRCMNDAVEDYGCESGRSIIAYFLSNASSWHGDVARGVKAELKRRIK